MADASRRPPARVVLFARYPVPGRAKTRLVPALGERGAADLHRRLVERTVATIRASGLPYAVACTGAPERDFAEWLGPGAPLVPQGDGGLGERLARVEPPVILLGADIPGLRAAHLLAADAALDDVPVAIGPASDGGYYCLALREPAPFLFADMPWGSERVFRETRRRLEARGMSCRVLEELADCDRPEDLDRWPELAP